MRRRLWIGAATGAVLGLATGWWPAVGIAFVVHYERGGSWWLTELSVWGAVVAFGAAACAGIAYLFARLLP